MPTFEELIAAGRDSMKSRFRDLKTALPDQRRGIAPPPIQKPIAEGARLVDLPKPDPDWALNNDLFRCIRERRSRRAYLPDPLRMEELAFLLWATQGVEKSIGNSGATLRTVPSAGARHPFETYVVAEHVEGLEPGVYRYAPLTHQLAHEFSEDGIGARVAEAAFGQGFIAQCPVVFVWTCVPYRSEWRYGPAGHKTMLLDAGHICQNLYLAREALRLGPCAVAAYDQAAMDASLRLDGVNEYTVYLAPAARPNSSECLVHLGCIRTSEAGKFFRLIWKRRILPCFPPKTRQF